MSERIGFVAAGVPRIEYARSVLAYLSGVFSGSSDGGLPAKTCRELKDALDSWLESHAVTALDYRPIAGSPEHRAQDDISPPQYRSEPSDHFAPAELVKVRESMEDE